MATFTRVHDVAYVRCEPRELYNGKHGSVTALTEFLFYNDSGDLLHSVSAFGVSGQVPPITQKQVEQSEVGL